MINYRLWFYFCQKCIFFFTLINIMHMKEKKRTIQKNTNYNFIYT